MTASSNDSDINIMPFSLFVASLAPETLSSHKISYTVAGSRTCVTQRGMDLEKLFTDTVAATNKALKDAARASNSSIVFTGSLSHSLVPFVENGQVMYLLSWVQEYFIPDIPKTP